MNIEQATKAMQLAFKIGRTPNLVGLHGEGKSSVVKQMVQDMGYHYREFRTGQAADAGDLTGLPQFKFDEKGNEYTHFVLPHWFPREERTIIFFDEVNRGAKDILNGVFEAILDLSMKGIKMPKDCHIVAACNPPTDDYSGTIDFNDKAFQDRFLHIKFKPTQQEFASYMRKKYPNSGFLAFLNDDNKYLRDADLIDFQLDFVKPSPRSWDAAMALEKLYDAGEMDRGLFVEMTYGLVGTHATIAAMSYKETHVGTIKAEEVLNNYSEVRNNVLGANKKGRTDIIGNLLAELSETFKVATEGYSKTVQDNYLAFISDLKPEQQFAAFKLAIENHAAWREFSDRDDVVELAQKASKIREERVKEEEKAEKKTRKKKGESAE